MSSLIVQRSAFICGSKVCAQQQKKLSSSASRKQLSVRAEATKLTTGAIAPFDQGFDPLGLSPDTTSELKRFREAELTHGRVAMLAVVGIIAGEFVEGSSFLFDKGITGPAIGHFQQVPSPFWYALGGVIFLGEAKRISTGWASPFSNDLFSLKSDYVPGEIGFDPLGLLPTTPSEVIEMKNKELSHCRLAMIAAAWFVVKELTTGGKMFPGIDMYPLQ